MTQIQEIVQTLETLPAELQQQVADYIVSLARSRQALAGPTALAQELTERRRQGFGRFKGLIEVPDDFDEPLDDFKEYI